MLGRTEPDHKEPKNIRIVVEDEEALYTKLSPEDEFNDSVKSYIRAKITGRGFNRYTGLTVISRKPIDEDRFRSAVSNWVRDEEDVFKSDRYEKVCLLIGLLLFGSALVVFGIKLQDKYEVARYSLVPIMGSLSLSRATGILVIDLPLLSSKIKLLKRVESGSMITFECHPDA
jgi:hypothetical protein